MDLKINPRAGVGAGALKINTNVERGESLSASLKAKESAEKPEAASSDATKLTISNLKNYVSTATSAVNAIAGLRAEQLKLAQEASSISQGARTAELDDQLQEIQTEIDRVKTSATFNGTNVLTGGQTLTAQIDSGEIESRGSAVAIGNANFLTQDLSISLNSEEDAAAAVAALESVVSATGFFADSLSSAGGKVEDIREADRESQDSAIFIESAESARDLSREIALQIGSPYSSELETQEIIEASTGNLDPDRVSLLLEED